MRLALPRPSDHPLARAVQALGWDTVAYLPTDILATGQEPPVPIASVDGVMVLSPAAAQAVGDLLPPEMPTIVTGHGSAEALKRDDLEILVPLKPRAEGIWTCLRERFPKGGDFLLARGHRSRELLEKISENSVWKIHPWITHAEVLKDHVPPVPEADAVLAMSPLQALALLALPDAVPRIAWGEGTAKVFADAGHAHLTCEPKPESLTRLLARITHA